MRGGGVRRVSLKAVRRIIRACPDAGNHPDRAEAVFRLPDTAACAMVPAVRRKAAGALAGHTSTRLEGNNEVRRDRILSGN